jgi:para-aminobenzoate synthetase / 4-amino-4-deoxychorismate lyase
LTTAVFESFRGDNSESHEWRGSFSAPLATRFIYTLDEVLPALRWAEKSSLAGYWVVVVLSYEAAPAFDQLLSVHNPSEFPLASILVFDQSHSSVPESHASYHTSAWSPQITQAKYDGDFKRILDHISAGDSYQVNYSFPLQCEFTGSSWHWYRDLCSAQQAGFCAYLDLGRYHLLSLSPELFFRRSGDRITTRPMKGTISRGRWLEEDESQALELQSSEKNRAENIMIVDLLRNDLSRISAPHSVNVANLCQLEKYETLWQMTSTIEAECRSGTGLVEVLCALFPCGSITGAPKIRTMEIIRELELFPRDVYTGAIGLIKPGGDCIFNVAIRTILLDTQTSKATIGIGGGITSGSNSAKEFDEAIMKAAFLKRTVQQFRLFETILLEDGEYFLLEDHLRRIAASAKYFDFVWNEAEAISSLEVVRSDHQSGRWKVRLLSDRSGEVETQVEGISAPALKVTVASEPIDSTNPFIFHKTTNRSVYESALHANPGFDDVILWNERNELTESTVANVVVQFDGMKWTPPRACGLLAGTFRDHLLQAGEIRERVIYKDELRRAESVWLINSVRKWIPIQSVDLPYSSQ